ncbi:hypothetical protein P691DRAFT_821014 [Macrolepiota fuliginosa MF-IS2]|uniref:Uncharacterized protein n=1 Tax=Macrolepiota fuliginosa MF-IS2 TaxID=1400762 RepID=A0A9P6C0L6_9AGAR|nr:hypothetical protein P691DRAFT_821014 [Macrolepiota fuliginosa MF-IS2]
MSPSTQQQLLFEDLDLISLTTISGLLFGIALSIYVLSANSLYHQLKDPHQQRQATFLSVYTTMVMASGIILFALVTKRVQLAYIDHNNSLGAPIEYQFNIYGLPIGIAESVVNVILDTLTLGIQIWRLWVIYSATQYALIIIIIPLLLFLCFIGTSNISNQYISIATMLIESYALETAWTLATLILYTLGNGIVIKFFTDTSSPIEIIAYLLVVYQVSTKRGWDNQTGHHFSRSLHFNHDTGHTSGNSTALGLSTQTPQGFTDMDIVNDPLNSLAV